MDAQTRLFDNFDIGVPHFAMWVGGQYYPTVQDFIDEAKAMGVSKRISSIPKNLVLGKSRIYLAHACKQDSINEDDVLQNLKPDHVKKLLAVARKIIKAGIGPDELAKDKELYAQAKRALGKELRPYPRLAGEVLGHAVEFVKKEDDNKVVFGYCVVSRVEFIVPHGGHVPDKIKKLAEEGHVTLVHQHQVDNEPNRGCGKRKPGGTYAVSYVVDEEAMKSLRADAKDVDLMGPLAVYRKPFRAPFGFFRGTKQLEEKLLKRTEIVGKLVGLKEEEDS